MTPGIRSTDTCKHGLMQFIKPFQFGSAKFPTAQERIFIEVLVDELARDNPNPVVKESIDMANGTWQCLYTSSRHVLDLDKMPGLSLSGVYQKLQMDPESGKGYYFNIGELSRGGKVRMVCGEYARVAPSPSPCKASCMDVRYEYLYFAPRVLGGYEGRARLSERLEENRLARSFRLPFRKAGWQSFLYLDHSLRVVRGNSGGLFVLAKLPIEQGTPGV